MKLAELLTEGIADCVNRLDSAFPANPESNGEGPLAVWGDTLGDRDARTLERLNGQRVGTTWIEVRAWPKVGGATNLFELICTQAKHEGDFTGLHEVFAGLLPFAVRGDTAFYLEAAPVRGDDEGEDELPRQVIARTGGELVVCADSLDSFVYVTFAMAALADGALSDEAWIACLERLHRKIVLAPFGLGDLLLDFDEYTSSRRDVEYWRVRSQWLVAALIGDTTAAAMLRQNAPHPEVAFTLQLEGSARYVPTGLYWLWRAHFMGEPTARALVAAAADHKSQLVRDAGAYVAHVDTMLLTAHAPEADYDDVSIEVDLDDEVAIIEATTEVALHGVSPLDERGSDVDDNVQLHDHDALAAATRAEILATPASGWLDLAWRTMADARYQTELARQASFAPETADQAQWLRTGTLRSPDRIDALAIQLHPLWEALLVGAVARGEAFIALPSLAEPFLENEWTEGVYRLRDAGELARARAAAVALVESATTTDELLAAHQLIAELALAQDDAAGAGAATDAALDVLRRFVRRSPWDASRRGELADLLDRAGKMAIGVRRWADAKRHYTERAAVLEALRGDFGEDRTVIADLTHSLELAALAAREMAEPNAAHQLVDQAAVARARIVPTETEDVSTYVGAILAARAERNLLTSRAKATLLRLDVARVPDPLLPFIAAHGEWASVWQEFSSDKAARRRSVCAALARAHVRAAAPSLARAFSSARDSERVSLLTAWAACAGPADAADADAMVGWALREGATDATTQRAIWLAIASAARAMDARTAQLVQHVARGVASGDLVASLARDVAYALTTGHDTDFSSRFADVIYAPYTSQVQADRDVAEALMLAELVPHQVTVELIAPLATADSSRVRRMARSVVARLGAPWLEQIPLLPKDESDWCWAISSECVGAHRWVAGAWQRGLGNAVLRECEDLLASGRPLHGHEERFLEVAIACAAHSPQGVNREALAAVMAGYSACATKASDVRLTDVATFRASLPSMPLHA